MAEKTCDKCGQVWDTKQHGQCPTCQRLIREDTESERARKLGFGDPQADKGDGPRDFVEAVFAEADQTDKRATSLDTFTNLLASLGVLGGVVALFVGFTASGGADAFVIGAGIVNILFWLLLRSFGVAIAVRMNLAAAEARLRASRAEE